MQGQTKEMHWQNKLTCSANDELSWTDACDLGGHWRLVSGKTADVLTIPIGSLSEMGNKSRPIILKYSMMGSGKDWLHTIILALSVKPSSTNGGFKDKRLSLFQTQSL